eukprot:TRINITY_DN3070_c0_g1_i1.p1 TRINITY_DN3070_c0_g1~~TRINITY_DN3070_c0_g1_i1.p1  ORF type:complete len:325 (-),score=76.43 TRINITY_DN3070_c0_g1_i1:569-1543(-)
MSTDVILGVTDVGDLELPPLISEQVVSFTAYNFIYIFIVFWAYAIVVESVLKRINETFRSSSQMVQKNIVTYLMEIALGTALMFWDIVLVHQIAVKDELTIPRFQQSTFIGLVLCCMYLLEMLYRPFIRWQILAHHLGTIGIILIGIQRFEANFEVYIAKILLILTLTALTEQPIHVALLMYRFGYRKYVSELFYFSAVQNFLVKLGLHIWCLYIWGTESNGADLGFRVFYPIFAAFLVTIQVYASYIQFLLGKNVAKKLASSNTDATSQSVAKTESGLQRTETVVSKYLFYSEKPVTGEKVPISDVKQDLKSNESGLASSTSN